MADSVEQFFERAREEGVDACLYVHECGETIRFYMDTESNAHAVALLKSVIAAIEDMDRRAQDAS